jgi:hypothetical protein
VQGAAAAAAGLSGACWNTGALASLAAAEAASAGAATATFLSTAVDHPAGRDVTVADTTTLVDFPRLDGASLRGSQDATLDGSAFRFTGFIHLDAGQHAFSVGSDDGFELTVGLSAMRSEFTRAFATTAPTAPLKAGWSPIKLMYFENLSRTGVEMRLNGLIVSSNETRTSERASAITDVPLPGAMPLLLGAVAGTGVLARRRKAA